MYSISDRKFQQLEPYIRIAPARAQARVYAKSYSETNSKKIYPSKTQSIKVVELNTADSTQLETLRGIGPALSARIVKYRNRLGGFYKKEQLLDVYGLDSVKFEELKNQVSVDPVTVQKINVNTATFDEMKKHPYLSYKQMNAIIQYRKQHGVYRSVEDLREIAIINEEILRKIEPYLTY
jgi:competence ComEA-like helix-hairpin-helix protein